MTERRIVITPRDRALIRAVWSLGATTSDVLQQLVSPETGPRAMRRRLHVLCAAGYLRQRRIIGGQGHTYLYTTRPAASRLEPGTGEGWQPSLAQLEHSLLTGRVIAALVRGAALAPAQATGWQGEAELRSWARPGDPYPDGRLTWVEGRRSGAWLLEVDRGTESRAAWRRKLGRYLVADPADDVLAITPSAARGAALTGLARSEGLVVTSLPIADVLSRE